MKKRKIYEQETVDIKVPLQERILPWAEVEPVSLEKEEPKCGNLGRSHFCSCLSEGGIIPWAIFPAEWWMVCHHTIRDYYIHTKI